MPCGIGSAPCNSYACTTVNVDFELYWIHLHHSDLDYCQERQEARSTEHRAHGELYAFGKPGRDYKPGVTPHLAQTSDVCGYAFGCRQYARASAKSSYQHWRGLVTWHNDSNSKVGVLQGIDEFRNSSITAGWIVHYEAAKVWVMGNERWGMTPYANRMSEQWRNVEV